MTSSNLEFYNLKSCNLVLVLSFLLTSLVHPDMDDQRWIHDIAQKMNNTGGTAQQTANVLEVDQRTVNRWRKGNFADELPRGRPVGHDEDE